MMTTIELFAGIGGFSSPYTKPLAFVEKELSCRAVLRRHYPDALILDDVRTSGAHNLPWANIIKFGFPCQDLSVAGNRAGLTGARSGLFYEATRIVNELRPDFAVWENVPGLLSSGAGRDFLSVLIELERIGFVGGWTTLDAQFFGVAQRRQRVFGVFARRDIGATRCAEILSLTPRLPWNITAGSKARQSVAATIRTGSSDDGVNRPGRRGNDDVNIVAASWDERNVTSGANRTRVEYGLPANTLHQGGLSVITKPAIAQSNRGHDTGAVFETLRSGAHGALPMISMALNAHPGKRYDAESETFVVGALSASHGGADNNDAQAGHIVAGTLGAEHGRNRGLGNENEVDFVVPNTFGVRRLTPTECERLQGFEDGHTAWGVDEQGRRVEMSDSVRYRMLGNAVCKKVSAWLDARIVEHA